MPLFRARERLIGASSRQDSCDAGAHLLHAAPAVVPAAPAAVHARALRHACTRQCSSAHAAALALGVLPHPHSPVSPRPPSLFCCTHEGFPGKPQLVNMCAPGQSIALAGGIQPFEAAQPQRVEGRNGCGAPKGCTLSRHSSLCAPESALAPKDMFSRSMCSRAGTRSAATFATLPAAGRTTAFEFKCQQSRQALTTPL